MGEREAERVYNTLPVRATSSSRTATIDDHCCEDALRHTTRGGGWFNGRYVDISIGTGTYRYILPWPNSEHTS